MNDDTPTSAVAPPRPREGSLEAPIRHPLPWKEAAFFDEASLLREMERVFDICHGCRRCFSLCHAFPTLFDAVDASATLEVDGVPREVFWQVADHCYLCDLCYMTKCPYVPPHEWNVDFPHLMLRAKAVKFRRGDYRWRDKLLSATDAVGRLAAIPVVVEAVNAAARSPAARRLLDKAAGIHADAPLPEFHRDTLRRRLARRAHAPGTGSPAPAGPTSGKVVLFATCYGDRHEPALGEDLIHVLEHNGIAVELPAQERCCGMPRLELGDLEAVERAKDCNVPTLLPWVERGYDVLAVVPSCVLMLRSELPLLFPGDGAVARVAAAVYDPFEYLMLRHRHGVLKTDFRRPLGRVAYHAPCHQRVQNIGPKTRELLGLVPDTQIEVIERCSGHDGTYAMKSEYHETAMKIGAPVFSRVAKAAADFYGSDCPMAGRHIAHGLGDGSAPHHPITLVKLAYGL